MCVVSPLSCTWAALRVKDCDDYSRSNILECVRNEGKNRRNVHSPQGWCIRQTRIRCQREMLTAQRGFRKVLIELLSIIGRAALLRGTCEIQWWLLSSGGTAASPTDARYSGSWMAVYTSLITLFFPLEVLLPFTRATTLCLWLSTGATSSNRLSQRSDGCAPAEYTAEANTVVDRHDESSPFWVELL